MSKSEQWFMHGTFKCSPKELLQLFSIHAQTDHLTTPCVFILSKTRDEECYREAFGVLKDLALEKNINLNPKSVMSDFETASRNALKFHFPNVETKGCWFHFRQAINRKEIKLGLKKNYSRHDFRKYINMFSTLALIPYERVEEGFQAIKNFMQDDQGCRELYQYFERQWIKNVDPKIWNHFDSDIRTNNKIEGFHSGFNRMVSSSHPLIFVLINFLKDVQASASLNFERLQQCQVPNRKLRKEIDKNNTLENIKSSFKTSTNINDQDIDLLIINFQPIPTNNPIIETCEIVSSSMQNVDKVDTIFYQDDNEGSTSEIPPTLIDLIGESHILINGPQSNQVNVYVDRSRPLASVLGPDFYQDLETSSSFDYIRSTMNMEPVEQMYQERRAEREKKEQRIDERISNITDKQINEEVLRLWNLKEATGKRKRISKLDREEAHKSIVKKFRLEETNNMHLEYLQRHGSDLNN
ncbi:unnamed protein product [Brachionus calyciflorus]|uniref:MULE transposase domain-containing protein n=1 Tax=Brachionus calyciflorus TaxID=104777 RepID=A0A814PR04_9BILA|nr:unnamed protein product [Brachionus calyciflorus]